MFEAQVWGRRALLLATCASAFAVLVPATAAQAQASAKSVNVDEVVVTARRKAERLQDVPVAVTAITGAALERYNVTDVQAISQLVPSMVVGRQVTGSSASIFMRGVGSSSLSSGFEQSVSLSLDGIPMSRGREIINSQFDVGQVEVLKGPQALFFGRNSTGGVITITTRDPTPEFEASAKVGYEFNADETYGEAVVSGPITSSLLGRVALRANRYSGWVKNVGQTNSFYGGYLRTPRDPLPRADNLAGRATLKFVPENSPFDATLKVQVAHMKDSGAGPYERVCGGGRTTPLPIAGTLDPNQDCVANGVISWTDAPTAISRGLRWGAQDGQTYTNHNSQYAVLTSNYRLDKATLTSVTSFYSFKQTDMNHFGSAYHGNLVTQYAKFDQAAEEVRAVTDFDGPLNVTAGAIYAHGKFEFDTDAIVTATIPIDPATGRTATFGRNAGFTADTISAFAEATWNIQPTLELAGGARWTHEKRDTYQQAEFVQPASRASFAFPQRFDDHFTDSNVSPQATLTWRPDTSHTYYAAYKTGFKSGGYNTSQNLAATTKFTDGQFTSEKVKGGELGAKTEWLDGMLRANVVGFYYKYTNLQVQVYNSVTNTQIVTNVGALVTKGIEAQLALRNPGGITGLNLSADLSYDHAAFGSFPNASCYTGQSISAGCDGSRNAAGLFNTQVLTGKTPPKAPKWAGRVNGDYTTPVFGEYSLNFASSVGFSSKYNYTDALRPDAIQKGYARIDATVRLSAPQDRWQIALIGRNLTSEWVITSANDQTINTGAGPTGGPVGLVPDMNTIVDRGRQFYLEFSTRF